MSKNLDRVLQHMQEKTATFKIPMLVDERKATWIRPFKTKDQKLAVILRDEGTESELTNFENIINLLDEIIVKQDMAIGDWPMQDFIYFLVQFRIKALGEKINVETPCNKCGEKNLFEIDLIKDASIVKPQKISDDIVSVSDSMKLMLKRLNVEDMAHILAREPKDREIFTLSCLLKEVEFEGELLELTADEKIAVVGELTKEQAEGITHFSDKNDYGLSISKDFKCTKCQSENTEKFNGFEIINFF